MPIAELLGVQVDMQLLLKLSASVAAATAVLLLSWAYGSYRSYSSRKKQAGVKEASSPRRPDSAADAVTSEQDPRPPSSSSDQDKASLQKEARGVSLGSASNLPDPAATTGRRSPCFLQKLEGSVGVGRELRQDLECQGAYSSFLSKAEVKVEDARLVLEGRDGQIVRGKIYDYYVESSSHSVTNSRAESQPAGFGSRGSSLTDSPIVMRDLRESAAEPPCSPGSLQRTRPARPVLLRQESYVSAAEQCELPSAFLTSATRCLASSSDEPPSARTSPSAPSGHLVPKEGADLESAADLGSLKSKIDLGNCLEMLYRAKKHGQTSVQQAALRVMSDNYLRVLKEPGLYGRLMADEREQIQRQRMRGRRFITVADMDPREQKGASGAVYYYDDHKDSWHPLCVVPQEVVSKACAMCTMDNYLFVALGTDAAMAPSKRVFCYDPLTSIWSEIGPMNQARPRCKLAALEGCVYAVGGECLSSVERYDPRTDRWTFVAPLPNDTFAVAHHVAVSNGELFVSGGTLRCMLLRYSPRTDAWRSCPLAGGRDRTADVVAVGRFLYRFDVNPLLGVSVYRYHTVARLWYECSSRRLPRCPAFRCVALGDTVYCVSRQFTVRFEADEVSPGFADDDLSVLSAAKGVLFPFVLSLPDKTPQQTSV